MKEKEMVQQAKEIATYGFEQGFNQAIDLIKAIAEEGKDKKAQEVAELLAKALENVRPQIIKEVPDMFTFAVVEIGNDKKITLQ